MLDSLKAWLHYQTSYACQVPVEVAPCELAAAIIIPASLLLGALVATAVTALKYANVGPPSEDGSYRTR